MNAKHLGRVIARSASLVLIVTLGLGAVSVALALPPSADPPQPPRPTLTPGPRPTLTPAPSTPMPTVNPTSGPVMPPQGATGTNCQSICGQVFDLAGSGGVAGALVRFGGTGWALDAQADSAGFYAYGQVGVDAGMLNVISDGEWRPVTRDVAIAPSPGQPVIVNLGVYRGTRPPSLPIVPTANVSPRWANWGEQAVFTVRIENTLSQNISNVWVTDLLPAGLTLSGIAASQGDVTRAGNYAAVHTAALGAGEVMTVSIYVDVNRDTPSGALDNTISLIYSEYAAAQVTARLYVQPSASVPTAIPVTGGGLLPTVGGIAGLGLALWTIRRLRLRRSAVSQEKKD